MRISQNRIPKAWGRCCALLIIMPLAGAGQSSWYDESPDKSVYNFFNPTPIELLREMTLDGPGATESPFTVDAGHFQVEMTFYARSSYEEVFEGVTYTYEWWSIGPVILKAGLLNDVDVQLILEPYSRAIESEIGFYRTEREGFGDTTLRFKVNLWGNDSGKTALAFMPYFLFPTSEDGLGNHNFEAGFVFPFSMELPGDFYLGLTSQIGKAKSKGETDYHTEYRNSIALTRALVGDLEGYVEFYGAVSTEQDTQWIGTVNTGLAYWLTGDWQVNADVDIGVSRWADDWYFSFGMGWRY